MILTVFFCIGFFIYQAAYATCAPGHEGPPSGGSEGEEEKPKIPKDTFIKTIFKGSSPPESSPGRTPVKDEPVSPGSPYPGTLKESDCCELTSISIRNAWGQEQDLEVILTPASGAPQSKVIFVKSTHTFSGQLGKCVRITVKSTNPEAKQLLIEDIPICCEDLKKGKAAKFFSLAIVNFTSKPCTEKGASSPAPGGEIPGPSGGTTTGGEGESTGTGTTVSGGVVTTPSGGVGIGESAPSGKVGKPEGEVSKPGEGETPGEGEHPGGKEGETPGEGEHPKPGEGEKPQGGSGPGGIKVPPPGGPGTPPPPPPPPGDKEGGGGKGEEEGPLRMGIDITKCDFRWMPEQGNRITFTAKIYKWVEGRGWVYPGEPRVITFDLSGVSKEKGICLNRGAQLTPDLYFKNPLPDFTLSGGEGEFFAIAKTTRAVTEATVTVTSDDYGSFGAIKSSAADCEDIAPNGPVAIPFDDNRNTIADCAFQDDRGAPPANDLDPMPVLDGHPGDGYTNYEEYRGFFIDGTHRRTTIFVKDLMISDRIGRGIGDYPNSAIMCNLIREDEISAGRECNFNRGHATTGPQHGLIIRRAISDDKLPDGAAGKSVQIDPNLMGPPRNVSAVIIVSWTHRRVAHELGHSTCAWHHGEASWAPTWIYAPEDDGSYNNRVSSAIRRGWRSAWGQPPLALCGKLLPAQFLFHPKGAQQSGDVNCVMKYVRFYNVYSDNGMFGCWPADPDGHIFCASSAGTGYNSGGLVGGNASKGNCLGQLRVNDK